MGLLKGDTRSLDYSSYIFICICPISLTTLLTQHETRQCGRWPATNQEGRCPCDGVMRDIYIYTDMYDMYIDISIRRYIRM